MADTKISALTAATVPLVGTEQVPIVQGGETRRVSASDLLNTGAIVPVVSDFTITLNSPTVSNGTNALRMFSASNGAVILRALLKALPGGNFSVRLKFSGKRGGNFNSIGLFFRDTAGKFVCVHNVHNNQSVAVVSNLTNSTTISGIGIGDTFFLTADAQPEWLRADFDAATNDVTGYWSIDGNNWELIGVSPFLATADAFGIGSLMNTNAQGCLAFFERLEVV